MSTAQFDAVPAIRKPDRGMTEMIDRLLDERARDHVRLRALEAGVADLSQRAAELRAENARLRAALASLT
jgi:uncharacterized small protein (DUF1192 family)